MRKILLSLLLFCVLLPANAGTLLVLGDSLSAGYNLAPGQGWVELLQQRLQERAIPCTVVNASVSGDTTAGGLARLDALLAQHHPDILLLELGANDGLRGLPVPELRRNLSAIIETCRSQRVRVLLVGMRIPPNYGPDYAGRFEALYPRLAEELEVRLVPFLLAEVGGVPELNQGDGIHPTAEGQEIVAANVAPHLEPLLEAEWEERGGVPEDVAAAAAAGEAR
jgi:acyl-CoA thioesterase-1